MKNIIQVLKFEYLSCVKNKAFIITTLFIVAVMLLCSLLPALIAGIMSDSTEEDGDDGDKAVIAVRNEAYENEDLLKKEFTEAYDGYEILITDEEQSEIESKVDSGEYEFGVIIDTVVSYKYITRNNSITDETYYNIGDTVKSIYQLSLLDGYGIPSEEAEQLLNAEVSYTVITTGTDQTESFISTYIIFFILYMAILMYGQLVSNSVISEKNSRAMEMLISCAKPSQLMFGKVIGAGLGGLTQMVIIALAGAFSIGTAVSSLPEGIASMLSFPASTVAYGLLFFVLGFFIYAFMLAALSSLASRTEDLNTVITPVMIIFVAAMMIVIISLSSGNVDSTAMVVCSYIPFSAPMAMFARAAMTDVAAWEIILSVGVQLASIYLLGMLASAIYRIGVLMYGKPPKLGELFKLLTDRKKHSESRE